MDIDILIALYPETLPNYSQLHEIARGILLRRRLSVCKTQVRRNINFEYWGFTVDRFTKKLDGFSFPVMV
jgi:hypothetical protein